MRVVVTEAFQELKQLGTSVPSDEPRTRLTTGLSKAFPERVNPGLKSGDAGEKPSAWSKQLGTSVPSDEPKTLLTTGLSKAFRECVNPGLKSGDAGGRKRTL
jgi:hypothetical protein